MDARRSVPVVREVENGSVKQAWAHGGLQMGCNHRMFNERTHHVCIQGI